MSGGTGAGWHPDPQGRHELRYWDGSRWTEHVSDAGQTGVDPTDAPPPQPGAADTPPVGEPAADTKPGRGFPLVPVLVGAIVAAAVVVGLVVFVGGDDGGTEFGTSTRELTSDEPVHVLEVKLDEGEGFRFRVDPLDDELDLVAVFATDRGASDRFVGLLSEAFSDEFASFFTDSSDEDVFSEFFTDVYDDALSDAVTDDVSFGRGELFAVDTIDSEGTGDPESGFFVTPLDVTLRLLVYDFDGEAGEYELTLEKWSDRIEFDDVEDFISEEELLSDEDFFSDDRFFSG